jgi:TonB family protein
MGSDTRDDLHRDLAFFTLACMLHAFILLKDPGMRWGVCLPDSKPESDPVPVEFVQAPPAPSPLLAPMAPSGGKSDEPPAHGPGVYQPRQVKKGSALARKKGPAKPTVARVVDPERQAELRLKAEAARLERAERKRQNELRLAELRAQREEAARQKAIALAQAREERRRRKVELESQLASLPGPDEDLADAPNASSPLPPRRGADRPASGAAVYGERDRLEDPVYEPEGKGGASEANVKPSGGGTPNDGGGVNWALDGPAGNRRLMGRRVPGCPDWVSERGLDLTVQIKFQVLDDGSVKNGVVIKKTTGFPELDRDAVDALKRWRFEAVAPRAGSPLTWGVVTFRFTAG